DDAPDLPADPAPEGHGIYPGPVMQALKGHPPRWKPLGAGIRQTILSSGNAGSLRLLYIPPGAAVPDHGHGGLELTMVLQGSFDDETGHYGVGDVEVADDSLEHTPVAGPEAPCIALAATDAPPKFRALVPRLLQPLFRI
ncbi:MAG TPA: transcriptional regulator, partial [Rhodobacterales bacterium]|nr:transcriptional regulator [Rhodobacterales bacterium]